MKIMHCADLHLNAAFSGLDSAAADARRAELCDSFARAIGSAASEGVSLILIAGDLFDTPYCSERVKKEVFSILAGAGCPVVISPGNHDHYVSRGGVYSGRDIPENVFIFTSEELGRFDFDELSLSVVGYAYTSERYEADPLADGAPCSEKNVNILCAHTDIRYASSGNAPMTAVSIARQGFTYAALGHVHLPAPPQRIGGCTVAYSGFLQGRGFDEIGEGGVYIVDIDPETKAVSLEKRIFSRLCYRIERLDVSGCERDAEVIVKISELIKERGYGRDTALRVILCGDIASSYTPSKKRICGGGALSTLALIDVKDDTSPTLDLEHLMRDPTVRGEFYRSLAGELASDDPREREVARLALRAGLSALDRHELSLSRGEEGEEL